MVGTAWDAVLKKVPEQWVTAAAPAAVFWAGAMLAWATGDWLRVEMVLGWLNGQTTTVHLILSIVALVVVAASVLIVRRTTTPVLRFLEGYWPGRLDGLANRRRDSLSRAKAADEEDWQHLKRDLDAQDLENLGEPTARQRAQLALLEHRRRHRPVLDGELLPTRIGNIMRAAETRPGHRYGLNAVVIWPRLWLVLPEAVRAELSNARASLDATVATVLWATAFAVLTPWAWWAGPVGIAVAVAAVKWWVPTRAETLADLIEATYDLYRWEVYLQLRWPLPTDPADEVACGKALTQYLVRGSRQTYPKFNHLDEPGIAP